MNLTRIARLRFRVGGPSGKANDLSKNGWNNANFAQQGGQPDGQKQRAVQLGCLSDVILLLR